MMIRMVYTVGFVGWCWVVVVVEVINGAYSRTRRITILHRRWRGVPWYGDRRGCRNTEWLRCCMLGNFDRPLESSCSYFHIFCIDGESLFQTLQLYCWEQSCALLSLVSIDGRTPLTFWCWNWGWEDLVMLELFVLDEVRHRRRHRRRRRLLSLPVC